MSRHEGARQGTGRIVSHGVPETKGNFRPGD